MNWIKKIAQDKPTSWFIIRKDGKKLFEGSERDCQIWLHRNTSQSADWMQKYEGYTILNPEQDRNWQDHYNWYHQDVE